MGGRTVVSYIATVLTFDFEDAAVEPGTAVKEAMIVLADNRNDGHLGLDGKVEGTFLER